MSALVIVGGGPAGLAAARGYRDAGGSGDVVLLTDDDRPPYERPALSKDFLRGETPAGELQLEDERWYADRHVSIVHAHVTELDIAARVVRSGHESWTWDAGLVLALGAEPVRLPVPGADDAERVLLLRTVRDSERVRARAVRGAEVAVIGSGFVGCEVAASLARVGAAVTLVSDEALPQAARLGDEVGEIIAGWLRDEGVTLRLGSGVAGFEHLGEHTRVLLESGERLVTQLVVVGAGARPRVALAREAGLELDDDGTTVAATLGQRCSAEGVYAAGDVACTEHPVAGRALRVEHWGDALAQGEVAGRRAAGDEDAVWDQVPGFWSTIGDHTLKHVAWGDGHDDAVLTSQGDGAFSVRQTAGDTLVGVLTHEQDEAYETGRAEIGSAAVRG